MSDDRPRVPRPPATGPRQSLRRNTPIVDPVDTPPWAGDPAALSAIQELIEMAGSRFRDDAIEVLKTFINERDSASETRIDKQMTERVNERVKKSARPLQISLAGIVVVFAGSCSWMWGEIKEWRESERKGWELQQRQDELGARIVEHLDTEHVDKAAIEAVNARLDAIDERNSRIEKRLGELVEQGKKKKGK